MASFAHALTFAIAAEIAGCKAPEARAWSQQPQEQSSAAPSAEAIGPSPVDDGCEVLEHLSRCRLTSVSGRDLQNGDRELVASYVTVGDPSVVRVERRFGVSYLTADEATIIEHVRSYPTRECRWQTVLRGACPAASPSVDLPPVGQ